MISYARLWETMKRQGATTYTLQVKGGISSSTIRRMKAGAHTHFSPTKAIITTEKQISIIPDSKFNYNSFTV